MNRKRTARTTPLRHDLVALTLAAAASAIAVDANAASDIFAKIGSIKGESLDAKHKDQIEVLSWSWGIAGQKKKGAACGSEMTIEKYVDAASPELVTAAVLGNVISSAQISVRKAGGTQVDYLVISLNDVIVTSVASSAAIEFDRLQETMTLAYASATISYSRQNPDGTLGPPITGTVPASCASFGVGGGRFPPS
jgi:type VI secretion system secreted protein Hcp